MFLSLNNFNEDFASIAPSAEVSDLPRPRAVLLLQGAWSGGAADAEELISAFSRKGEAPLIGRATSLSAS